MWRFMRMLRVADGPDEVHKMVIARRELNRAARKTETPDSGDAPRHAPVSGTDGSAEPAKATT
jgi:acyl-CoA dehydrogenase